MRRVRGFLVLLAGAVGVACGAGGTRPGAAGPAGAADLVVSNRGGAWRVYELQAERGARLVGSPRADDSSYEDRQPARLPDGTIVFTSTRGGHDAMYLADRGATSARPLFSAPEESRAFADSDPAPCGTDRIVFARAAAAATAGGPGAPAAGEATGAADRDLYL
ncbi:MAG TPA: hypothetical protein VFQ07_13890, partial [Candidatus Polarisedimenticolia bacterium]|nr:hypothetical protein [Candidatus Polarisedimenticolia bacterium]